MKPMLTTGRVSLMLLSLVALAPSAVMGADETFRLSAPRYWLDTWAIPSGISQAGDADGDGRAELVAVDPAGTIAVARTSPLGKWVEDPERVTRFGTNLVAAVVGRFMGSAGDQVVAVGRDGAVLIASAVKRGTSTYSQSDRVGTVSPSAVPSSITRGFRTDLNHDGRLDALFPRGDGELLLLLNQPGDQGRPRFVASVARGAPTDAVELGVGKFGAEARNHLVWIDSRGNLFAAALTFGGDGLQLGTARRLLEIGRGAHLAVGRFLGHSTDDIIAGRRLLPGGDPTASVELDTLPAAPEWRRELWWCVGDVDGNGMDDLIRKRDLPQNEGGTAVFIHFASHAGDAHHGYLDDDLDGLPDEWETGAIKPGGLDLKALGCKPGRADVIVEIERFDTVDVPLLQAEVPVTVRYFASLPVANPDGTRGIAMHIVYRPPTPHADFDTVVKEFDKRYPPRHHIGAVHTMFCGAEGDPGFSVALLSGVNGKFHLGPPIHDVMSHEFGHELGLGHDGFQPHNCPIYNSIMNYTYIIGAGHRLELAAYSEGALSSLVLNERHLSERLPFPLRKVEFLAMTPFQYRLAPSRDGRSTLIDWNWNGVLGEENVVADINYDHGTDFGSQYDVGRADAAPVLVTHGAPKNGRLLLFVPRSGGLHLREWLGTEVDKDGARWSREIEVEPAGVVGDPTAAYARGATWVAYRTADRVVVRRIVPGGDHPTIGPAKTVPGAVGEPTLASFDGRLALLLWRSPDRPIGLRLIDVAGHEPRFASEEESGFASAVPVAAVEARDGETPALCVGLVEVTDPNHRSWTEVRRFVHTAAGRWRESRRQWVNGEQPSIDGANAFAVHAAHRMSLLWRPEPGFEARGRLYHFSGRGTTADRPWSEQFITMEAPVRETGTGWFSRSYYFAEAPSASAPGACWFRDDIAYAVRVHDDKPERNDVVKVGFYGSGALPEPMSDFNDVAFIHRVGLSHSLRCVWPQTEAATPNLPGPVPAK